MTAPGVRTDNYIKPDGLDRMELRQGADGEGPVLVTATLVGEIGQPAVWLIEAEGQTSATAETRQRAIELMGDMSLVVLGVEGATLYTPPEVVALP